MTTTQKLLRQAARLAFALTALLLLTAENCGPPIIANNGFEMWCGETLCDWDVESGSIDRRPTWHESDDGVGLVGDRAAIAQRANGLTQFDTRCLRLEFLAEVDLRTRVTVQIDVNQDGTNEFDEPIPATDWATVEFLFALPKEYQGATFRVVKHRPGNATLAQIRAFHSDECF